MAETPAVPSGTYAIQKHYTVILEQETAQAKSMAYRAVIPRPIGVWDVLIPIVFIMSFLDTRRRRHLFVQNLLFTRRTALEAALVMAREHTSQDAALSDFIKKTDTLLAEAGEIYTESIRDCQLAEIDLLIDHYRLLLDASGDQYEQLVMDAYGARSNYQTFLDRLTEAEQAVTEAARQCLGERADATAAKAMEAARERARRSELDRIFLIPTPDGA